MKKFIVSLCLLCNCYAPVKIDIDRLENFALIKTEAIFNVIDQADKNINDLPMAPPDIVYYFHGHYYDNKCTLPVVHHTFMGGAIVFIPEKVKVRFEKPYKQYKVADYDSVVYETVVDQVIKSEDRFLFKKDENSCIPAITGFKVTPNGCHLEKVCRSKTSRMLTCNHNDCRPGAYEGSDLVLAVNL